MEAPFEPNSWDGVTGAIYTGFGGHESIYLAVTLALVAVAIYRGWRHELHAYQNLDRH